MSIMTIQNQHVGKMLVGPHAQERWRERSAKESLKESLERSMPFGGQYGDNLLLIDGEVVFACEKYGRAYFVKTVLTKDQAVANMEFAAGGHQVYNDTEKLPKKLKMQKLGGDGRSYQGGLVALGIPDQDALFERHKSEEIISSQSSVVYDKKTLQRMEEILRMDDAGLEQTRKAMNGRWKGVISLIQRRRHHQKISQCEFDEVINLFKMDDDYLAKFLEIGGGGTMIALAKYEMSRRAKLAKQMKHNLNIEKEGGCLRQAMREMIPAELVQKIYDRARVLRAESEQAT